MENFRISTQKLNLIHLPTFLLVLGYPLFWVELFFLDVPQGRTTPLSWILFFVVSLWTISRSKIQLSEISGLKRAFNSEGVWGKIWILACTSLMVVILGVGLYAGSLPPHLVQESDVLIYHITVPRQHLILSDFTHIPWSVADLYFLPVDFALAPFWLSTPLPNKIPQFLFFLGLMGVIKGIVEKISDKIFYTSWMLIFALLGSHMAGIQLGTGMLDLVLAYLFLASVHSFLEKRYFLSAVEFCFYFWSKSFIPLQIFCALMLFGVVVWTLKVSSFKNFSWGFGSPMRVGELSEYTKTFKRVVICFFTLSIFIAGPFIAKSVTYTGSPLFPFGVGLVQLNPKLDKDTKFWNLIYMKSEEILKTKDSYGSSRSAFDFLKHLWLIAVPEKNVNNRYDYPVGLVYLLAVGPFLFFCTRSFKDKVIPLLPIWTLVCWTLWWFSSQQSRFLFIPLFLMYISVFERFPSPSKVLKTAIFVGMLFTALSVVRAHKADWGKRFVELLRPQDRVLIDQCHQLSGPQPLVVDFPDVAYADCPVNVQSSDSIFVINP